MYLLVIIEDKSNESLQKRMVAQFVWNIFTKLDRY